MHLLLGAIGSLASAATVAASSFDMAVASPQELIDLIPDERWSGVKGRGSLPTDALEEPQWVEPPGRDSLARVDETSEHAPVEVVSNSSIEADAAPTKNALRRIKSKVYRLGDFVDTDAVS